MVLSLNRIRRIHQRIVSYEDVKNKRMTKLHEEFADILRTNTIVIIATFICYILLYVSIITSLFGDFWLLSLVQQIVGVVGSTVLIIFITFLHWYMGILVSDAHTIASEIIALGEKYKK